MEGVRAAMKTRHLEADQWLNRKEGCLGSGRQRQLSQDRKDRWMDGWVGGWMDGWMDGQTDRQTDRQIDMGMFYEELERPANLNLQDLSLCGISSKTLPCLIKGGAVASSVNCLTVLYKCFK